jgi:hypothetical protein
MTQDSLTQDSRLNHSRLMHSPTQVGIPRRRPKGTVYVWCTHRMPQCAHGMSTTWIKLRLLNQGEGPMHP